MWSKASNVREKCEKQKSFYQRHQARGQLSRATVVGKSRHRSQAAQAKVGIG